MAAPNSRKPRVLIVEDDPDMLELFAAILEQAGYQVSKAEHALAAVCTIVRSLPDLIVADIRMPIMDGFALVRELKSSRDTAAIPVVAVTGMDTPEYREAAFEAGCAAFVSKPIDPARFSTQIGKLLKRASVLGMTRIADQRSEIR